MNIQKNKLNLIKQLLSITKDVLNVKLAENFTTNKYSFKYALLFNVIVKTENPIWTDSQVFTALIYIYIRNCQD